MPWEGLDNDTRPEPSVGLVSRETGFVSLAVGESIKFQVDLKPDHELIKAGERYEFCFRGLGIKWWRFGWVEELEAGGVGKDNGEMEEERPNGSIVVPCSNLVEFLVGGEGK